MKYLDEPAAVPMRAARSSTARRRHRTKPTRSCARSITLFALEHRFKELDADERLQRRQAEAVPLLESRCAMILEQKERLLPKHPLAEAIGYALNQWSELTLFLTDPAVPIHNNLAEQQLK